MRAASELSARFCAARAIADGVSSPRPSYIHCVSGSMDRRGARQEARRVEEASPLCGKKNRTRATEPPNSH